MPSDISLPGVSAVHAGTSPASGQRSPAADPVPAPPVATPIVNPTLRLDAALGLVVIEFHNDSGAITTSIPSQRQLQEYQRWQATRLGPAPQQNPGNSASPQTGFSIVSEATQPTPEMNQVVPPEPTRRDT
jgi:hypothetical protein